MSSDQRFSLLMTAIGLGFTTLSAALGFTMRSIQTWTKRWTQVDERLTEVINDAREDRRATNERLTWLERNAWPAAAARGGRRD